LATPRTHKPYSDGYSGYLHMVYSHWQLCTLVSQRRRP